MSVKVNYTSNLEVVETLATNVPAVAAGKGDVTHSLFNKSKAGLTGGSGQPCTQVASFAKALSAGSGTIDLTALSGTNGAAVSLNGLKVQFAKFQALANNANPITLAKGASNGYELLGAGWSITLQPGQEVLLDLNNAAPAVGGSAKTIDLSGTGTQGVNVELVGG